MPVGIGGTARRPFPTDSIEHLRMIVGAIHESPAAPVGAVISDARRHRGNGTEAVPYGFYRTFLKIAEGRRGGAPRSESKIH